MAENTQTFILVGDFKDNITPKLTKLNREIEALSKNFTKISTKLRPISKEFGNMAAASERMSSALKAQRGAFDSNIRSMTQYRREVGKLRAANDQLAKSQSRAGRGGRGGAGGGIPPIGGGGGSGGRGGSGLAAAAGGFVAGEGIANGITSAIVRGFNIGVGIMQKPFRYAANAIGERIQDEMSDISSAGGMFAVDKRDNLGIFKSFDDARRFQEDLNAKLAQSAAALPGETSEYVQQAKMLTDSMMISFGKNKEAFTKFAKSLDSSVSGDRDALATVTQKFTEKAVLLGKGSGGSSAYGVPQILEMLLSQEKVNVKAFQRFTAYRANPLFKNALEAAEGELKKTAGNSAERLQIIQRVLDEAIPNDVVMAMQNSADGIYQAVKSAFLDPEAGLLGFGRKIDAVKIKARDSLGRFINDAGDVVKTAEEAAEQSASLFQLLREIVGGFVLPLTGLIDILPQLYDPLAGIAKEMVNLRDVSQTFFKAFNEYTAWFEQYSTQLEKGGSKKMGNMIRESKKARGSLAAINNLLASVGAIDASEFEKNAQMLKTVDTSKLGDIAKNMFGQLFDSKFMEDLGRTIGSVVGSTLKALGDFMAGVSNLAEAGPFAKGLAKGFEKAKGGKGISMIFKSLFGLIGRTLMTVFKSAPLETSILAALTVGIPLLQGAITTGIMKLFGVVAGSVGTMGLTGGIGGMGATIAGWLGIIGPALRVVAQFFPPFAATLATIVILGGGVENTMRQLQQIFGEMGHTISGSFSGLADVTGTLIAFIGDLGSGIGRLLNAIPGVNLELDLLKIILTPITAAFQALELGLLGLNVVLTKVRSWMSNWLGTEEEKKANYQASVDADVKMRAAQGRQNAYNMSMQGEEALKVGINKALYELNNSKELKASRSAELKSFVAEAKAQLGQKPAQTTPKPGAPAAPAASVPGAAASITPKTLAPLTTAIATGTTATQAVNTSTQGVQTAVKAAETASTQQATQHTKLINSMIVGINNVKSALTVISAKVSTQATLAQVSANTAKTNSLLESGKLKVSFDIGGIGGKGGPGAVDAFNPIAASHGLQVTSGYRPGDPGYHGANRARDYSNGSSPTPQMMNFAKFMAATAGGSLAELIYTPLGFSIKDGKVVPPYAQAGHYDHVHVAFGQGFGHPTLFSNPNAAMAYERMMAPAGAKISTVTANSSEFGDGRVNLTQNINIDGAMDPKATAEAVWAYTTQAVDKLRYNNFG